MEKVFLCDPLDGDDRSHFNSLLEKGWRTATETVIKDGRWEGDVLILYHIALCNCPQCRYDRGEIGEYMIDGDEDDFTQMDEEEEE